MKYVLVVIKFKHDGSCSMLTLLINDCTIRCNLSILSGGADICMCMSSAKSGT